MPLKPCTHTAQPHTSALASECSPARGLRRSSQRHPASRSRADGPQPPPLAEGQPCLPHGQPRVGEGGKAGVPRTRPRACLRFSRTRGPAQGPSDPGQERVDRRARAPFPAPTPLTQSSPAHRPTPWDLQVSAQGFPPPRSSKQLSLKSEGRVSITKNCERGGKAEPPGLLGSQGLGSPEAPALPRWTLVLAGAKVGREASSPGTALRPRRAGAGSAH